MSYYNFNTASKQANFDLIPKGTLAKVNMNIKLGHYKDPDNGWVDGYPTKNNSSGAIYLACEFTILEGVYAKRKVWSNIGIYSSKNDNLWGAIGRGFIRSILSSAKGFSDNDNSEQAQTARKINSFAELDGIEFVARIDVEQDNQGSLKNVIKHAIDPSHVEYSKIMGLAWRD